MINKIKIEKYKCFKNFQLANLKHLNIIVGNNGVGKSVLLEYIEENFQDKNNQTIFFKKIYDYPFKDWFNLADWYFYRQPEKLIPFIKKYFLCLKEKFNIIDIELNGRYTLEFVYNKNKKVCFQNMGDAVRKIVYLLLSIHEAQHGILLIDEIENSINYTNMQIVWEMLLSASKEFNVQLFITTHSYEMLEYLQKAIENQPQEDKTYWQEQLSLYSLLKINSEPSCFLYSYAGFESFIENNREFR